MIPSPWVSVVLALAAFRLTRLVSYDDFPPIVRIRTWVIGAKLTRRGSHAAHMGISQDEPVETWTYPRPVLTHFLGCVYCVGFWVSCMVYVGWLYLPTAVLYACAPFALSAATGIIARRLDP